MLTQLVNDPGVIDFPSMTTLAIPPLDIHNYPNPFSDRTTFIYSIPSNGQATLAVYNRAGEHIVTLADEEYQPGIFTVLWDGVNTRGEGVAPGIYLYTLTFIDSEGSSQSIVKTSLMHP